MAPETQKAAGAGSHVPIRLYEEARRRLLVNEPMRAEAGGISVAAALTTGEADALESVGLSTARWAGGALHDPLMRSIADYMALLETSFTTTAAARYLKVGVSRIRQRLRERSLYGIEYDGERRLPRFQFERKQVLPGLREVVSALPEGLNPLDVPGQTENILAAITQAGDGKARGCRCNMRRRLMRRDQGWRGRRRRRGGIKYRPCRGPIQGNSWRWTIPRVA